MAWKPRILYRFPSNSNVNATFWEFTNLSWYWGTIAPLMNHYGDVVVPPRSHCCAIQPNTDGMMIKRVPEKLPQEFRLCLVTLNTQPSTFYSRHTLLTPITYLHILRPQMVSSWVHLQAVHILMIPNVDLNEAPNCPIIFFPLPTSTAVPEPGRSPGLFVRTPGTGLHLSSRIQQRQPDDVGEKRHFDFLFFLFLKPHCAFFLLAVLIGQMVQSRDILSATSGSTPSDWMYGPVNKTYINH